MPSVKSYIARSKPSCCRENACPDGISGGAGCPMHAVLNVALPIFALISDGFEATRDCNVVQLGVTSSAILILAYRLITTVSVLVAYLG